MKRSASFILFLAYAVSMARSDKVQINVKSGEVVAVKNSTSSDDNFDEWPSDMDLSNVEIRNEGEDATGSMSPMDLMIRSFEKLPDVEQTRIGFTALLERQRSGIPMELDELYAIWNVRQAELKEAMEAMSETAEVLTNLINQLENATRGVQSTDDGNYPKEFDEDTVLDVLYQLEDHLSDVDNAKDFHDALGGWPLLTGLLSPKPRWRTSMTLTSMSELKEDSARATMIHAETPHSVRGMAALVIGTAVKNEAKYKDWVLESVVRSTEKSESVSIKDVKLDETVVAAIINLLNERSIPVATKRHAVYAIGSAVRHNMPAQAVFNALHGIDAMHQALKEIEQYGNNSRKSVWGLRTKLLNLVVDFLEEAYFEVSKDSDVKNSAIIDMGEELAKSEWVELVSATGLESGEEELTHVEAKMHEAGIRALISQWRVLKKNKSMPLKESTLSLAKKALVILRGKYHEKCVGEVDDENEYFNDVNALINTALDELDK